MIATRALAAPGGLAPRVAVNRRRYSVRHRRRPFPVAAPRPALRPGVWRLLRDDRRAIRLKLVLLAMCVIGAGLLEVRW
jgi:hypothetical protein